jgi:hypothetical protein
MADKASNWVPLTNEKLFFAQTLLAYYKQEQSSSSLFAQSRLAALEESIVIHLYNAYQSLLCELAAEHSLVFKADQISLGWLNEQLQSRDDGRREIAELLSLVEQPSSWLSELFLTYQARFIAKQQKSEYQGEEPEKINVINAIEVVDDEKSVRVDLITIHECLKKLIDDVRSYRLED